MIVDAATVSGNYFDYVVVGGGTAGLAVAARLAEDPLISVLVLEAGEAHIGDPNIISPTALGSQSGQEKYDWDYTTTTQSSLGDRTVKWPRGKILGGTSAINYFFYHRPCKADVDAFSKLGNLGWDWALLETYFKKAEKFIPPVRPSELHTYDEELRGKYGPIAFTYPTTLSGFETPYHDALTSMGIARATEPFSGDIKGTWPSPMSVNHDSRSRSYAANGYYEPKADSSNLLILPSAQVCGINTSQEGERLKATDVAFRCDSEVLKVRVGREVILSAGVIGSPQILELSGIGDKDVLLKAGIDAKLALEGVGSNLQDRIGVRSVFELNDDPEDKFLTTDCLRDPEGLQKQLDIYNTSGTGVFATSTNLVTFEPLISMSTSYEALQRDLVASVQRGAAHGKYSAAIAKQHAITLENIRRHEPSCEQVLINGVHLRHPEKMPVPGKKYVSFVAMLSHPFSRGSVHISSKDVSVQPTIDPNYFDEPYDLHTLVEIVKFSRRLVQQDAFKKILSGIELFPGSEYITDEELADCVKNYSETFFHTVGSCSMLPREDGGVVDTELKVYGTTNIRVVDISVVPLHVAGHTQSLAYAIAELAADIIKGKISLKTSA